MEIIPVLWYEKNERNSDEIVRMKQLLDDAGVRYQDMHSGVEVGLARIEYTIFRFCGVNGIREFLKLDRKKLEEQARDLVRSYLNRIN